MYFGNINVPQSLRILKSNVGLSLNIYRLTSNNKIVPTHEKNPPKDYYCEKNCFIYLGNINLPQSLRILMSKVRISIYLD